MQLQICNSGEVWTSVSAADAHRIVRKRTGALAKMIRAAWKAEKQEAREYRRAERELQKELQEADRRNRALWKRIRVKPDNRPRIDIERKPQSHRPTRSGWLAAASHLPRYSGPIVDRMGRTGIFFRVRYYGHATRAGVGRRATLYIWQGAHETDDGRVLFMSNVGESIEEAVAALEAVELFNREAQTGAKVLFHAIANVPYQLIEMDGGVERMFEIGRRFAEQQFGSRDLPFALALHPPSDEGDQRNWHLHTIFSARPLVRTDDHQWDIGRMMRREIDNPEAFEKMRHLYARVQTEVAQEAGLNITYSALSNVERGLPNAPQKHLDPARTARVRRGERDEVNERNWEAMLAGEAALLDEQLRHAQEQAAAEQSLLDRVEAQVMPLVADLTAAVPLTIAIVDNKVEPVANLADVSAALVADEPVPSTVLSLANLQWSDRTMVNLTELRSILPSDARELPFILPVCSAVRDRAGSIVVPNAGSGIAGDSFGRPVTPSLSGIRIWQHHLAGMPRVAEPIAFAAPPLFIGRSRSALADRVVAKPPSWAAMPSITNDIGLSLGVTDHPSQRLIDVPKQGGPTDGALDHDIDAIFRLLDAHRAKVVMRERTRRARIAAERAEAERTRKALEDQHAREQAEQQQLEADSALTRRTEREAAEALDTMLKTIEVERIFIAFADERCVVDDAVAERFGVNPIAIASADLQARLDVLAARQRAEIKPVVTHVLTNGGHIVRGNRGWTLSADAPIDLRLIADAWVHEPVLQQAFAQAAAVYRTTQTDGKPTPRTKPTLTTSQQPSQRDLLILAAQQREALTERWQRSRRYDDLHAPRGREIDVVQPRSASAATPRRQLPFDSGRAR